ncbi:ion transporter [Aestuariibacter salexigens]|uniref:ion transporter n=1 Tax=Aestuariibacter salexigens TaxID=226010 RepID=UPI0003FD1DF8|nr:ion transporter [Aestuariibacter salexigens]
MQASSLQQKFIQIRSNKAFELFVIGVILLSAVLVGAKTFEQPPSVMMALKAMDLFITLFFLTEITIRFVAEEKKSQFFKNFWNVFDTLIVLVSIIPIDNSESAVIARLVRVFRVLRMISIIPELRILLVSLVKALPQLGYVMLLMFIIFYIYAAVGATFFSQINPVLWGDIALALLTLFRVMTFEDWTDVMYETMEVYPLSWIFYLTFIFLSAFAFLNMVIGIVVNVMEQEHEKARAEKLSQEGNEEPTLKDITLQLQQIQSQLASLQQDKKSDRA